MEFSVILNWILGGGLLAAVNVITTLKATVLKAKSEAERAKADADKAKAEAETVRIDNAEHATRILIENIVEPLKKELSETREELRETKKEFGSTKREMARFRKAVETANGCKFRVDCPVLFKLRDLPKGEHGHETVRGPGIRGQPVAHGEDSKVGDSTAVRGETGNPDGQPP